MKTEDLELSPEKLKVKARLLQAGLHEVIHAYVKEFNKKHARHDAEGKLIEAFGTYTLYTYAAKTPESSVAATLGASRMYAPGGAEGFEALMSGLLEDFKDSRAEITLRALEAVLEKVGGQEKTPPKDATIN